MLPAAILAQCMLLWLCLGSGTCLVLNWRRGLILVGRIGTVRGETREPLSQMHTDVKIGIKKTQNMKQDVHVC